MVKSWTWMKQKHSENEWNYLYHFETWIEHYSSPLENKNSTKTNHQTHTKALANTPNLQFQQILTNSYSTLQIPPKPFPKTPNLPSNLHKGHSNKDCSHRDEIVVNPYLPLVDTTHCVDQVACVTSLRRWVNWVGWVDGWGWMSGVGWWMGGLDGSLGQRRLKGERKNEWEWKEWWVENNKYGGRKRKCDRRSNVSYRKVMEQFV